MSTKIPTIAIVIGSNGNVGSKLVEALLKKKITVIGVGRSKNYRTPKVNPNELQNFTYLRGDITKTAKFFKELNPLLSSLSKQQAVNIIVYNFSSVKKSEYNDIKKTSAQVDKIGSFYQALSQLKKKTFCDNLNYVVSGSYIEYSYLSGLIHNQSPNSIYTFNYAQFKTLTQLLSRQYAELFQIPTQYVILSHIYGNDGPFLVDSAIKKFSEKQAIEINTNGNQIIPFVFIDDVVDDLMKIGFIKNTPDIFSLYYSNSQELPLKEILTTIQKHFESVYDTKLKLNFGTKSETGVLPPLKRFTKNPTSLNDALKKILPPFCYIISGVNGYIGSNFAKFLLKNKVKVIGIGRQKIPTDLSKTPWSKLNDSNFHYLESSLPYEEKELKPFQIKLQKLLPNNHQYIFYHFAWSGKNQLTDGDLEDQLKNVVISTNCIKIASALNFAKFIQVGSLTEKSLEYDLSHRKSVLGTQQNYAFAKIENRKMGNLVAYFQKIDYVYVYFSVILDRLDKMPPSFITQQLLNISKKQPYIKPQNKDVLNFVAMPDTLVNFKKIAELGQNKEEFSITSDITMNLTNFFLEYQKYIANPQKFRPSNPKTSLKDIFRFITPKQLLKS